MFLCFLFLQWDVVFNTVQNDVYAQFVFTFICWMWKGLVLTINLS